MSDGKRDTIGHDRSKSIYIIFAVVLGAILCLSAYHTISRTLARVTRDFMSPYLKISAKTGDAAIESSLMLNSSRKLSSMIVSLERRNAQLLAENDISKRIKEENIRLRSMLNLPSRGDFKPVSGEVIARSSAMWRERFTVGRGSDDGVAKGNAVVSSTPTGRLAVIGRVIEVSKHTCVVATLYSEECRFSAAAGDEHVAGALEYVSGAKYPKVSFLPVDGTYRTGEVAVTSGISAQTPDHLLIGSIAPGRIPDAPPATICDMIYAEVDIIPFVNIDDVRFVIIYTVAGGGEAVKP